MGEVQPIVKSEPVSAAADVDVVPQQQQYPAPRQQSQQQVNLKDKAYADESYDYGEYGDGGYDDGSGTIELNTGLSIQGAGGADWNKAVVEMKMWRVNMWEVRATRVCIVVNTVRPIMP